MSPLTSKSLFLMLPAAMLLAACDQKTASNGSDGSALAKVGGEVITESDMNEEARWRTENGQQVPGAGELIKEMVDRLALVEQAKRSGIADEPGSASRNSIPKWPRPM
jgi:hypothetical protein